MNGVILLLVAFVGAAPVDPDGQGAVTVAPCPLGDVVEDGVGGVLVVDWHTLQGIVTVVPLTYPNADPFAAGPIVGYGAIEDEAGQVAFAAKGQESATQIAWSCGPCAGMATVGGAQR